MPIIVHAVLHKIPKAVSDTPNGTHSVESGGHPAVGRTSEAELLAPEEHSQNGIICGEANTSSGQEAGAEVNEEPSEGMKTTQVTPTPPTLQAPPPSQATPTSPLQPPSLVQSSAAVDETNPERGANVRTAPPALVGYETLEKQDVSSDAPADAEEMETKVIEERPIDAMQDIGVASPDHIADDKSSVRVGGSGDDFTQQKHDMREESPTLVIDMGSQSETEGEGAPVIIGKPETGACKEGGNRVDTSSATHASSSITQTMSESSTPENQNVEKPTSPQSTSSNDEDVDLDMDIIEEGEEEGGETPSPPPPPLPPPKGMLVKQTTSSATSLSSISSPGHIQSLSSVHSRIGVSPSHTASRLAIEGLRKGGNDAVRKPNVIVVRQPATVGGSTFGGGAAGNDSPSKEGGGGTGGGTVGGGNDQVKDRQTVVTDNFRVRQVAKVKQFFTTLQQFGNQNGSEVAEQVQELITAVVVSSTGRWLCMVEIFHSLCGL